MEYAGEVVRPLVADARETRLYDSTVGAGTYIFSLDDHSMVSSLAYSVVVIPLLSPKQLLQSQPTSTAW